MSDEILRYTDLAAAIQLAKANGMTTREIVRELTRGMSYSDALKHAQGRAFAGYWRDGIYAPAEERMKFKLLRAC